ncbi:MAG: PAS domain S-box protein [Terrimicrobiaceae bacterium]|nr:PAS domain S-box protein [Terrimicrobiaceae bacterium]
MEGRLEQLRKRWETFANQTLSIGGAGSPEAETKTISGPLCWERFAENAPGFAALFTADGILRCAHQDGLKRIGSPPDVCFGPAGILIQWLVDWEGREAAFASALRDGFWTGNIPDRGSGGMVGRDLICSIIPVRADGEILFGVLTDSSNAPACLPATVHGSELRFRALAEALPQLVWEAAPDGRVLYYNRRIRDYHGASRDPATGAWKWEPLVHPDDQAETIEAWETALATGGTYEIEHRVRMATGAFRWHLSRGIPIRDGTGAICRWFGTATDIHQSREAAEALARNEMRLRLAQRAGRIGIWEWTPDGATEGTTWWSDVMWEIYGRPPDPTAHIERLFRAAVHPDDIAGFTARSLDVLRSDATALSDEFRIVRPDGGVRWIRTQGSIHRAPDGAVLGMVGVNIDITDSKVAQEEIRRRAEELEQLMNVAPVAIWVSQDPECAEIIGNRAANHLYQAEGGENVSPGPATRQEIDGPRRYFDAAGKAFAASDLPMQKAVRTNSEIHNEEVRVQLPDGTWRTILGSAVPLRDPAGAVRGALSAFLDITARTEAEEELKARERQLANLADNTPDILARFDRDFRYVFVNSALTQALGLPASAVLGRTKREVGIDPEICDLWENAMRRALETGEIQRFEFSFGTPGDVRAYDSRVVPEWSEGSVRHLLAVIHDVTAQKRIEEELRSARDAAESASRARDKFLAVLSHELRTPLSPVLLTSSVLARDASLPQSAREAMAMIQRNVKVEARLIDDLLDLSRVLNGKLHLERQVLGLHGAIHHAVENCAEEASAAGLEISEFFRAPVDLVSGDSARLQQVFWNLLKNAIKFTPAGGRVEIETTCAGGHFVAVVRDTGIGIPESAIGRLFQAFEQAGEHIGQRFGGLGLGLAICKGIIDLHGGTISAASGGVGRGAAFTVRLPLQRSTAADSNKSPDVETAAGSSLLRVLLVEDHADTADAVARLLRSSGAEVTVAHTAEAALNAANESPFDLLISDLGLPDLRGTDLIRRLHAVRSMPGIAMSGYGAEEDLEATRAAGFAEHLVKPIDARELENAIQRVTRGRGSH